MLLIDDAHLVLLRFVIFLLIIVYSRESTWSNT